MSGSANESIDGRLKTVELTLEDNRIATLEKRVDALAKSPGPFERAVAVAEILNKALIPFVVAYFGYLATLGLNTINTTMQEKLAESTLANSADDRDAAIMKSFAELYEKNPKLALQFVAGMRRSRLRTSLLRYSIWDMLEKNIDSDAGPMWNTGNATWHMVGDAAYSLRSLETNEDPFETWWECDLRLYSIRTRWPQYRTELEAKFAWLETTYKLAMPPDGSHEDFGCALKGPRTPASSVASEEEGVPVAEGHD